MTSQPATLVSEIDNEIATLHVGAQQLGELSIDHRIDLAEKCVAGVMEIANDWVVAACRAKCIPPDSRARAEEITAGPVSVVRYLRLLLGSLRDIRRTGRPTLPGRIRLDHGQLRVPVFPTKLLYDALVFIPMRAETWLDPEIAADAMFGDNIERISGHIPADTRVCVVLGAGNVSAIPATDALTKILQENRAVLLKMNPVNDYLGNVFEQAFAPLIEHDFLRIVYGAAKVGSFAIEHDKIDEVHITGSIDTHDIIVWGPDTDDQKRRRTANQPVLNKPITSELGNVSPWTVVPGAYTHAQLRSQANNIAASITNNASFNCIATKVLITWKRWPDRERFLDLLEEILRTVPPRFAYYPGAADRFAAFAGQPTEDGDLLPWTLLRDADPDETPHLFQQESFVCVCAETALDADSPTEFLSRSVEFMNERTWGTLSAAISVPRDVQRHQKMQLEEAIRRLRYGTIGINQWPGVAFALMSPPWGGFPGNDIRDAQSGIGFVHNTFLLDRPQKTVLRSPLTMIPKPVWFPTHRNPEAVAWKLLGLYGRPTLGRLPGLLASALRG